MGDLNIASEEVEFTDRFRRLADLVADKLASNRDDLETALNVEKALPKAKAAVMLQFWEDLYSELSHALGQAPVVYRGKDLREITDNYFKAKGNSVKHVGLKYTVGAFQGRDLCLYINLFNAIHYGLRVDNASGSPVSRLDVKKQLREKLGKGNAVADKEDGWLVCYYYNPSASQEPLVLNFEKFDGSVLELLDKDNRKTIISNMVDHQMKLIEEAKLLIESGKG